VSFSRLAGQLAPPSRCPRGQRAVPLGISTWYSSRSTVSQYLWRAVDQDGNVLNILVTSRRDAKTATGSSVSCSQDCGTYRSADHRQAGQLRGGPPTADTQRGAPSIEVPEQPGGELPPIHQAEGARDGTFHLARARAAVPVGVQRDITAPSGLDATDSPPMPTAEK
jgi:hypothetical protein